MKEQKPLPASSQASFSLTSIVAAAFLTLLAGSTPGLAQDISPTATAESTNRLPIAVQAHPFSAQSLEQQALTAAVGEAQVLAATSNSTVSAKSPRAIKPASGGASAQFGLQKVFFPTDPAGTEPFRITTPDGRRLSFQPRFLAWHNPSTDERWLLGQVTSQPGVIIPTGEVWYTNAFGPDLLADLRFRYGPLHLEQDVIVRDRPPLPEGQEAANLRLEVWTEWFHSEPSSKRVHWVDLRRGQAGPPMMVPDEQLDFTTMRIGDGHAFAIGQSGKRLPVAKKLVRIADRDWLIEVVDYPSLAAWFAGLGESTGVEAKRTAKAASTREELIGLLAASSGNTVPFTSPQAGAPMLAVASFPETPGVLFDFAIYACVPTAQGIISWWPAGGNAQDAITASGNSGTLSSGGTSAPGKVGQGWLFDGETGYVQVPNATLLNPLNGLTIEGWVYFTQESSGWNMPILSKDGAYGRQYLLTKTWDDVLRAHVGIQNSGFHYGDGQIVLQPETWHHVAMTYSAAESALSIYVDGVLDVSLQVSGFLVSSQDPLCIGGAPFYGYYWNGGIDELSLYDRALSASEIAMIHGAGVAGKINPNCVAPPADMAAWFPGDLHPYSVVSGHTATLTNGADYAPAPVSHGFRFDGVNDAITVPDDDALDVGAGQDFSLEVWLKAEVNVTDYGVMSVIGKRYTPSAYSAIGYELFLLNGQPGIQFADASGFASFIGTNNLRDGGWHHVLVAVDRDSATGGRIYVDGIATLQFNPTSWPGSLANGDPLRVGVHPQSNLNCFFKGIIDEATFYRRALSATEASALYQAGSAGKCKTDQDQDGLSDWWEMQSFGNLLQTATGDDDGDGLSNLGEYQHGTNPSVADTDGDGLSDGDEVRIWIDINNPALGYLDPLSPDTGNTGIPDGDKDGDKDCLGNLMEFQKYGTDPWNPNTRSSSKTDGEVFYAAYEGATPLTEGPRLSISRFADRVEITVLDAPAGAAYDIYMLPDWNDTSRWRIVGPGAVDQRKFTIPALVLPSPAAFFVALDASDNDQDGLSSGWEVFWWGSRTDPDDPYTDADEMPDGWEAAYGLDPTNSLATHGDAGDPEPDGLQNSAEYGGNKSFNAPSYDPWLLSPAGRPIVSIQRVSPDVFVGGTAEFEIRRNPVSTNQPLTVYFALGGTAFRGIDYTVTPDADYVTIPPNATSTRITITSTALAGVGNAGSKSVIASLNSYRSYHASAPAQWSYVLDMNTRDAVVMILNGILINLERTVEGYLKVKPTPETTPLPFVNVATSGRGTVSRIEVPSPWNPCRRASQVIGEYYTAPHTPFDDPSRTTVDRYGNVWVGNRGIGSRDPSEEGAITKIGVVIGGTRGTTNTQGAFVPDPVPLPPDQPPGSFLRGPFVYNTCVDRNGDGLLQTSRGMDHRLAWDGGAQPEDEAIIYYVRTAPINVRSMAVDRDNQVWVGSRENGWQELINDNTGSPVTGQKMFFGKGGYGAVLDPKGVLWSTGFRERSNYGLGLLRLMPDALGDTIPGSGGGVIAPFTFTENDIDTADGYGIGIDPVSGDVWAGGYVTGCLWRFSQNGCSTRFQYADSQNVSALKGVVCDGSGDMWVAHNRRSEVFRFRNGELIGSVPLTNHAIPGQWALGPTGLSVDSRQHIWAICYPGMGENTGHYALRINPAINKVVEVIDLAVPSSGASGPYNYSDMSGFVVLSTTQPAGVWDLVQDSGAANTLWSSLILESELNSGDVFVEVRAADSITELTSWPFQRLVGANGTIPLQSPSIKGRYIEVRVNLLREFGQANGPVLKTLTVVPGQAGPTFSITKHPQSQTIDPNQGSSATFEVEATGTGLAYQWFKLGQATSVGSASSLTTTQPGEYFCRVTDASGVSLESAHAQLHKRSAPSLNLTAATTYVWPTLGAPQELEIRIEDTEGKLPLFYQWRKNGVPIPGAYGVPEAVIGEPNIYRASYTIPSVSWFDRGNYSVIYTNEYWKAVQGNVDLIFESSPKVLLTSSQGAGSTTLHAQAWFGPALCFNWIRIDADGKRIVIATTPTANYVPGSSVSLTLQGANATGTFSVEVADESGALHTSTNVHAPPQ